MRSLACTPITPENPAGALWAHAGGGPRAMANTSWPRTSRRSCRTPAKSRFSKTATSPSSPFDGLRVLDRSKLPVERATQRIDWDEGASELDGHPHYMHKEIFKSNRWRSSAPSRRTSAGQQLTLALPKVDRRSQVSTTSRSWRAARLGTRVWSANSDRKPRPRPRRRRLRLGVSLSLAGHLWRRWPSPSLKVAKPPIRSPRCARRPRSAPARLPCATR